MNPLFSPPRDILPFTPSIERSSTSSSGFLTGMARRSTSLTSAKIAVFAPMPSASDRIATAANPGLSRSRRAAYRRSRHHASSTPIVFMR